MQNQYRKSYWLAQTLGWMLYSFLSLFTSYIEARLNVGSALVVCGVTASGIFITHFLRFLIVKFWRGRRMIPSSGRWILLFVPVLSLVQVCTQLVLQLLFVADFGMENILALNVFYGFLNWLIIFYIWLALYLLYRYIEQGRQAEIQELRLTALQQENELNQLKAQLNPHFLFNAMNSIRALVNENPEQAREAITRLSEMLRSTFMYGKKNTISLGEELVLVKDYLSIERLRFEERLTVFYSIDDQCLSVQVPPFVIQTLVENAIKHGIGKLAMGGSIQIGVRREKEEVEILVSNTGTLSPRGEDSTGIGWENTKKRLQLLFGNKAQLSIGNNENNVNCYIRIPYSIEN